MIGKKGGNKMKHVMAFDVSMGKSTMVIYDHYQQCEFEGEIEHTRSSFEKLHETIEAFKIQDGQAPEIVFEATGVYSKGLESFLRIMAINIVVSIHLKQICKWLRCVDIKRIKVMPMNWRKSHFKVEREKTYQQEDYYEQMRALTRYYDEVEYRNYSFI